MLLSIYLAFKELWRNRYRFLLLSLVISLLTTLALFTAGLAEGLGNGNKEYIEKLNADLIIYQKDLDLSIAASRISFAKLNDIRRVEGVKDVGPIGFSRVSIVSGGGADSQNISMIGVEPGKPGEPPTFAGRGLRGIRRAEAVIDQNVATRTGLKVGDRFTIKSTQGTDKEYYELEVVGISDGRQYAIQPSIIVPYLTWDKMKPKAAVAGERGDLACDVVGVQLDNPQELEEMARQLEEQVSDIEAVDRKTAYEALPGYKEQQRTLDTQRIFALAISALIIGGFFRIQVLQKVPQIGMLKAIGTSSLTVAVATVAQIVAITVLGVLIGGAETLALALIIPANIPLAFTGDSALAAVISLLVIGILGGMVSVRTAVKVEPLIALRLA
jgi:putative ABC transport system permease protein